MKAFDGLLVADEHSPFDAVLELPDIAGPVILQEHVNSRGGNTPDLLAIFFVVFLEKIFGQQQDIGTSFPHGRQVDWEHVKLIVQILPELGGWNWWGIELDDNY